MRFFLQMGHGMMAMDKELIGRFNDGRNAGVIMWPRTVKRSQVEHHAKEILNAGASVLFDTCFYLPRTGLPAILDYPYWSGTTYDTIDFSGQAGKDFCKRVIDYQVNTLHATEILLPGAYTNSITNQWLEIHHLFAEIAGEMQLDRPIYSTIALGPDVILNQSALDNALNEITAYPTSGIYFVYHPGKDAYLPTNQLFLVNLLSAFLSLSLADKAVILGYANQADILFAATGVQTLASGNFRNVRNFDPAIFDVVPDAIASRKTWYYDGQSMGEYLPEQLGIAYQRFGMGGIFGPSTPYVDSLLKAPNPAIVNLQEPDAFKHFLTVLREQWLQFRGIDASQRLDAVEDFFREVKNYQQQIQAKRFTLGRPFTDALSAIEDAITSFRVLEADRLQLL
ncbi:MAG TPA: hypothetical protein VKT82_22245 [Ktedonobacterales bacterium]|nr:hypothetical protein [Ktedonobacterales bacterium]